jgi:NAD(P)-dependent dehydrogenase (short-subunit alcohol dehydrogenase family)
MVEGGMNVAMLTHMPDQSRQVIDSLGEYSGRCIALTNERGHAALFEAVAERFGTIDVVIPNQGAPIARQELADIAAEDMTEKLRHQITQSFALVQAALPYLTKSKAGRVILVASSGARDGLAEEFLCDSVARGGVISMTYSLARELAPAGITVNCIAKGGMGSNRAQKPNEYDAASFLNKIPMGRTGTPAEFGAAVAYLASEEAGFVTGQILNLCGGMYMG